MAGDLSDSQFVTPAASPPSPGSGLPYPRPDVTSGLSPTAIPAPPPLPPAKVTFAEDPTTRPPKLPPSSSSGRTGKRPISPIAAGIVVFLLLIAGLGAGLYVLTSQPRFGEIRRQAEEYCAVCNKENAGDSCECDSSGKQTGNKCQLAPAACASLGYTWQPDAACTLGTPCSSGPTPGGGLTGQCPPDPVVWCATFDCPNGDTDRDGTCNPSPHDGFSGDAGASYVTQWGDACPQPASGCGQKDKYNAGEPGGGWDEICGYNLVGGFPDCGSAAATATPRPTRSPSATPTPEPTTNVPECREVFAQVKDQGGGWVDAPSNDLAAAATAGDQVRFVVRGSASSGAFTRAAFFINGTPHIDDVVQISPKKFAVEYTLPDSGGQIGVEAVLFHDSQGWVD